MSNKKFYVMQLRTAGNGMCGWQIGQKELDFTEKCSNCSFGIKYKEDVLYIRDVKDKLISITHTFETLISSEFLKKMNDYGIVIPNLIKCVHFKTKEPMPFFQLYPTISLPPFDKTKSKGYEYHNECSIQHNDGYSNKLFFNYPEKSQILELELVYDTSKIEYDILENNDIIQTIESAGNTEYVENFRLKLTKPILVVSDKFKELVEKEKIRNVVLTEVKFE